MNGVTLRKKWPQSGFKVEKKSWGKKLVNFQIWDLFASNFCFGFVILNTSLGKSKYYDCHQKVHSNTQNITLSSTIIPPRLTQHYYEHCISFFFSIKYGMDSSRRKWNRLGEVQAKVFGPDWRSWATLIFGPGASKNSRNC